MRKFNYVHVDTSRSFTITFGSLFSVENKWTLMFLSIIMLLLMTIQPMAKVQEAQAVTEEVAARMTPATTEQCVLIHNTIIITQVVEAVDESK